MKIGDNIGLFASNQLDRTTQAIQRSLTRLSTGNRVNSPADDPGAYSQSITFDTQVRGYTQAIQNLNATNGMFETASSSVSTQIDIVQKMRELALQASNGTLTTTDRSNISVQFQALLQEFSRITFSTQFDGVQLLDGSFGSKNIQSGAAATDSYSVNIGSAKPNDVFQKSVGTSYFQQSSTNAMGNGVIPLQTVVGDFNGDGIADIASASGDASGSISVFFGNGNGTFQAAVTLTAGGLPEYLAVGDFNGDGKMDIASADQNDSTVSIFLNNGNGTFNARTTYAIGFSTTTLVTTDLNGDGKADLVGGSSGGESILIGNGDGTFKAQTNLAAGANPRYVAAGDINNDGKVDLVVSNFNVGAHSITVFLGNGDGTFQASTTYDTLTATKGIRLGDFNGDGKLDVIGADNASPVVTLMLGNGNGTFQAKQTLNISSFAKSVEVGDFNGDHSMDIVATDSSGVVNILLNNGNGTFTTSNTFFGGNTGNGLVNVGDFNRDGVTDIVTADAGDLTINTYLGLTRYAPGLGDLNLATQASSSYSLNILNTALQNLTANQAQLGAAMSRLQISTDFASALVADNEDNLSQVKGVDIALETSNLVRNQILQQAQVAVLGQANIGAEVVLNLLKNLNSS